MRFMTLFLAAAGAATALAADNDLQVSFRPEDFPKKVAACKALNRAVDEVKDIEIHYVDVNPEAERTIFMVHGWPSLWASWKYQIEEFKNDYRLIIPDNRGFGPSTSPGDVKKSGNLADIIADLVCVLEHAGVNNPVACMGHDWGSILCYQLARMRPDLTLAVVGITVPYLPNDGPFYPTTALIPHFPKLSYQVLLGWTPEIAAQELDRDVRRTLRTTLRTVASPPPAAFLTDTHSYLKAYGEEEIPAIPFFTPEEEDYWVEQYSIQGFGQTFYFYTPENQKGTWDVVNAQGNRTIPQPVLSIVPDSDPVANWVEAAKILKVAEYVPHLTTHVIAGEHWIQLENPKVLNDLAGPWIAALPWPGQTKPDQTVLQARPGDEL